MHPVVDKGETDPQREPVSPASQLTGDPGGQKHSKKAALGCLSSACRELRALWAPQQSKDSGQQLAGFSGFGLTENCTTDSPVLRHLDQD